MGFPQNEAEAEESARRKTTIRFVLAISIPMWAAVGSVTGIMVWLGTPEAPFAFLILVVAVFAYFGLIRSVVREMRTPNPGSTPQNQLAVDLLRQEISNLNEKVDAIQKALEE